MKRVIFLGRILAGVVILSVVVSACAPIPVVPPGVQTPTVSVFLPEVELPGVDTSPLQPTAPITAAPPITATVAITETAVPAATSAAATSLVGPVWEWESSTFQDGTVLATGDPSRYTLQLLPDGNALVQADCNFGTGTYQETQTGFTLGPVGTTKIACPPDSLDSEFLGQLRNIDRYVFNEDGVLFYLLDDAGTMQFRAGEAAPETPVPTAPATPTPVPSPTAIVPTESPTAPPVPSPASPVTTTLPAGLVGVTWVLAGMGPDAVPGTLPAGAAVTLEITPDGQASGRAACNRYSGSVTVDEDQLAFGTLVQTEMACEQALMTLERAYLDALMTAESFELSDELLTIRYDEGQNALVFTAATEEGEAEVELDGTSWTLESLTTGDQAMPPLTGTEVTLQFDSDGTGISGSTGCNQYRATLTSDSGGLVVVGPALMTRKACAANIALQEVEFMDALLLFSRYSVSDDQLTLLSASGDTLLVFVRK